MYVPEVVDFQLPLAELPTEIGPEQIPNVTKGISQVLEMCEAAGLDSKGFGCGMSVAPFDKAIKLIIDCFHFVTCCGVTLCSGRCCYTRHRRYFMFLKLR